MSEQGQPSYLEGIVNPDTTRDEFLGAVKMSLNANEINELGGEEVAPNKIVDTLSYLGVFAPAPATFDIHAFNATAGSDLPENESAQVFQFLKRTGLVKKEDIDVDVGHGFRYSISPDIQQMLIDTKNGFLTED